MNLARLRPGDTVTCDVRGRRFDARVVELRADGVLVDPPPGVTYYNLTARQVVKRHPRLTPTVQRSQYRG